MTRKRSRTASRPLNALPDALAAQQLQISRMTLFRKLKDGTISPPAPLEGATRRWWRAADLATAREQLHSARNGRTS
jgi:hypothetical protein